MERKERERFYGPGDVLQMMADAEGVSKEEIEARIRKQEEKTGDRASRVIERGESYSDL